MSALTLREVAGRLGCTPSTAWRLVRTGQLEALAIRGRGRRATYRVEEPALAAYRRRVQYRPFEGPVHVVRIESQHLIDAVRPQRKGRA